MSSSKNAAELCTLLVDTTYGELTSRIFALLLRRGRLTIPLLAQHSRLTPRQLRQGLAVLIQQNLVYHNTDPGSSYAFYEANPDAAYALIRTGKILEAIEQKLGAGARGVVQNLFLLGHAKISDLQEAYKSKRAARNRLNGQTNGQPAPNTKTDDEDLSPGQLDQILVHLLEAHYIEPVVSYLFRSPADTYAQIEKDLLRSTFSGSTKGNKQKDELKGMIASQLRKLRPEAREWRSGGSFSGNGLKRGLDSGPNGPDKRRKMANGIARVNGSNYDDEDTTLDPDLVVRVNNEKCLVLLRSRYLAEIVEERIGETTSEIYADLLGVVDHNVVRCRANPDIDGPVDEIAPESVSILKVSSALRDTVNPSLGLGKVGASMLDDEHGANGSARNGGANHLGEDEDEDESEEDSDDGQGTRKPKVKFQEKKLSASDRRNREADLKKHLFLLAQDNRSFLKAPQDGGGNWAIEFHKIVDKLRLQELDTIILHRFGKTGLRLVRMLREYGKLDEKQLPNIGLLKQRDVRTKLIEMQMAGFVDIQEVPRDSNRTPSRTMFFWYFDTERVSAIVLDSVYKAMSRALQVLEVEKHRESDMIALAERSDVRGQEEEMLSPEQLTRLHKIREKEEQLLGLVFRLDELVGIFKDY